MCCEVGAPVLELVLFVRTQWASMFACLDRALTLQTVRTCTVWLYSILIHVQAMTRFAQLADDSEDVPKLHNRKYSWFRMSKFEWDQVKLLYKL